MAAIQNKAHGEIRIPIAGSRWEGRVTKYCFSDVLKLAVIFCLLELGISSAWAVAILTAEWDKSGRGFRE